MGRSGTSSATKPTTIRVHPVWPVTPTAIRASPTALSTNNAMSFIGGLGATGRNGTPDCPSRVGITVALPQRARSGERSASRARSIRHSRVLAVALRGGSFPA